MSRDLESGTTIGDYRIENTIGSGGTATVYAAIQPVIGKRVAIKVLHQTKSDNAVNRFIKEARAVNLIGHPNIVDVFGFGMTEDGLPYLVMELLEGETLAVRAARKRLSHDELCDILSEVTHALEAAHEVGIIHRDLKPDNIFLARRRHIHSVKLLDFGIAKLFGDQGPIGGVEETRPGVLIATPRYISPEQVRGTQLDGRVDIYSLGVVMFELLTGRAPFNAANSYDLIQKHAKLKPPLASSFEPKARPADELVNQMLAKSPDDRPTLAEIRRRLEKLRDEQTTDLLPIVSARPSTTAVNVVPAAMATPSATEVRTVPMQQPPNLVSRVVIAGAVVLLAALIFRLARSHSHAAVPAPQPAMIAPQVERPAPPPAPPAPPVVDPSAIEMDPPAVKVHKL